jgi:Zn-dependent protease with chaperone function
MYALKNHICTLLILMCWCPGIHRLSAQSLSPKQANNSKKPDSISPYIPCSDDSIALADTLALIEQRFKLEKDTLHGDNRKYLIQLFNDRFDNLKEQFTSKSLLTFPEAQKYLNTLVGEIVKNNPVLNGIPINVYFAKTGVPNAAFEGDGVIVFNLGLFARLQNESQAVFVLCHEMAHLYLNHINKAIYKYVNTLYSKETQEQLRHIQHQQYNKGVMTESLAKAFTFDYTRHSRDHESEADSMGLVFMHNTRFDLQEGLSCLALLDTIDVNHFQTEAFIRQNFNAPSYPFQSRWLHQESGLLGGHAELKADKPLDDSLKTHPDCQARITRLTPAVQSWEGSARRKNWIDTTEFEKLKGIAPYEILRFYTDSKQLGRALFVACELLNEHPGDPYAVTQMGVAWNNICQATISHTLSKTVPLPAPWHSQEYNTLLQFIQNLYLDDMKKISYYFLQQYQNSLSSYPAFVSVFKTADRLAGNPTTQKP